MKKTELYRNEYVICICEDSIYQFILWQFDNAEQLADFLGVKVNVATQTLYNLFNHKTKYLQFRGKCYLVDFIKVNENID